MSYMAAGVAFLALGARHGQCSQREDNSGSFGGLLVIMSSSIPSRFWLLVILSGLGSLSCFGYAGIQTIDGKNPSATRQIADDSAAGTTTTTSLKLRNPISFVRELAK